MMRMSLAVAVLALASIGTSTAAPYVPRDNAEVLAELPPGAAHVAAPELQLTRTRLDVALPLAQFYIGRSRATGDLRYLGYAEAALSPWLTRDVMAPPAVLVLHATILQSRHAFAPALKELDEALAAQPDNAQAWLTRATVLRVVGRYTEAGAACEQLSKAGDANITTLCVASVQGLTGHLESAYTTLVTLPLPNNLPEAARAWRYSELGEMAERLGLDSAAERWFKAGLQLAPDDFYMRAAYGDLLLRTGRNAEVLELLNPYRSMEPMLLRIAIAASRLSHSDTGDSPRNGGRELAEATALLANAFAVEQQRGDPVHRREQARFLLDVAPNPEQALAAALENWNVQREPEDALILIRAAQAARRPRAAAPALDFIRAAKLEDVRL